MFFSHHTFLLLVFGLFLSQTRAAWQHIDDPVVLVAFYAGATNGVSIGGCSVNDVYTYDKPSVVINSFVRKGYTIQSHRASEKIHMMVLVRRGSSGDTYGTPLVEKESAVSL